MRVAVAALVLASLVAVAYAGVDVKVIKKGALTVGLLVLALRPCLQLLEARTIRISSSRLGVSTDTGALLFDGCCARR